jgi:WD40 repeat protein
MLATGTGSWPPDSAPGEIKLWNVATGKECATLGRLDTMVVALAFSPDGKTLASASRTVKLWDVPSAKEKKEFGPNEGVWLTMRNGEVVHRLRGSCWSVAFSPDGKTLAVGVGVLEDQTPGAAILYDVATGQVRATVPGHQGAVTCMAFSPDGKMLASADSRGTLKLWDVTCARERADLRNTGGTFRSFLLQTLTFTSNSQCLVATMMLADLKRERSGVVLKEWDVASGKERSTYGGTPAKGFPLILSPDAAFVGLACPPLEGDLVGPSARMALWDRRALDGDSAEP